MPESNHQIQSTELALKHKPVSNQVDFIHRMTSLASEIKVNVFTAGGYVLVTINEEIYTHG